MRPHREVAPCGDRSGRPFGLHASGHATDEAVRAEVDLACKALLRQAAHRPIYGATFSVHQPGQTLAISPFIWDYLGALLVSVVVLAILLQNTLARRTLTAARILILALCAAMLLWRQGLHASAIGFEAFTARPTVH